VQPNHAGNILVGFGRIEGRTVGVVANQPMVLAAASTSTPRRRPAVSSASAMHSKSDHHLRRRSGFLPGVSQEHNGIIKHGAKLLFAYAEATVPKITVITRKPMAARTTLWPPSTCAATSTTPGPPPKSR